MARLSIVPLFTLLLPSLSPIFLGLDAPLTEMFLFGIYLPSQGLLGSADDMGWDSLVPQVAPTEGWGEGTYAALIGFHFSTGLDYTQTVPLQYIPDCS